MSLISARMRRREENPRANRSDGDMSVSSIGNSQRTLAENLVNAIGILAALNFARERQWQGVVNQIRATWLADSSA